MTPAGEKFQRDLRYRLLWNQARIEQWRRWCAVIRWKPDTFRIERLPTGTVWIRDLRDKSWLPLEKLPRARDGHRPWG